MIQRRSYLERRTPIKRGKPPKRKAWVKRRRATPRVLKTIVRDEAYKAACRQLPCIGIPPGIGVHAPDCLSRSGPSQASHVGLDKGMGIKGDDRLLVPQSDECHKYLERSRRMLKEKRRAWLPGAVARTHVELERRGLYTFEPGESKRLLMALAMRAWSCTARDAASELTVVLSKEGDRWRSLALLDEFMTAWMAATPGSAVPW